MSPDEARGLIVHPSLGDDGPQVWADLGCGDGTFTIALASLLPSGSTVHAIDQDARSLERIPARHNAVTIVTHSGDFTEFPWPFDGLSGVLVANSLHYVRSQAPFLRNIDAVLRRRRILLVEYDMTRANRWVPCPIDRKSAVDIFRSLGYTETDLGRKRSAYGRGDIYALLMTAGDS